MVGSRAASPAPKTQPGEKPAAVQAEAPGGGDAAGQQRESGCADSRPPRILARSVQCYLLMGARLFQQSMRSALAPLMVFMAEELHISTAQKGSLLSAIAAGYFFTQVPGGALADRLGAKNVVTAAMGLSACCCLAIPTSIDQFGVPGLWVTMALMGAVQGPLFPTSTVFLSRWMPKKVAGGTDEKAWGTSMLDIGISVGSLVTIPIANGLAGALGWRQAYHIMGLGSLAFVALWQCLGAEEPRKCHFITKGELSYLEAHITKPQAKAPQKADEAEAGAGVLGIPLRVAMHPGLWAVFMAHVAFNYGFYYLTNWGPTYYKEVLRVPPESAKYHLMVPHLANMASISLSPALVKWGERRGLGLLALRRLFTCTGLGAAAAALLPANQLRGLNPWACTVLFSVANACFGLAPSGFKANYLDITERYVGVISGYGNTLGTVGSWIGPQIVAALLERFANWDVVFASLAAFSSLAALNYAFNSTVTPIELDLKGGRKDAGKLD